MLGDWRKSFLECFVQCGFRGCPHGSWMLLGYIICSLCATHIFTIRDFARVSTVILDRYWLSLHEKVGLSLHSD